MDAETDGTDTKQDAPPRNTRPRININAETDGTDTKQDAPPRNTRLHININAETAKTLRDTAEEEGTTVTEVVRRATSVYAFFNEIRKEGDTLQLVGHDGQITQVRMIL
ncbi:hypothetical protein AB0F44_25720 [Nocardioides sp. NPDC023903]|uniref:hypothetical protein n=1 Tax=Nocardioides sp. NPDC023903 TaxID=3157195 RepID=UPI0033CF0755